MHGVVFSFYMLLFLAQTALISAHKVQWHKSLGLAAYGLAALMIPLGLAGAVDQMRRYFAAGPPYPFGGIHPLTFAMVPVMGMVMFGTLIACSYAARFRPDVHKRLALYATISMMDAGIDRWPLPAMGMSQDWASWIYVAYLLLPAVYDLISLRRVHRVAMTAAPFVFVLHALEIPLGATGAWHAVGNVLLRWPR